MKYRKKPVVIDAVQWQGDYSAIFELNGSRLDSDDHQAWIVTDDPENALYIKTLEGTMKANIGDYIIKGVKGELYPCKPDVFEATYELVE